MNGDDYYERATVRLCVDVRIGWKRNSESARRNALDAAVQLAAQDGATHGAAEGGCFWANVIAGSARIAGPSWVRGDEEWKS